MSHPSAKAVEAHANIHDGLVDHEGVNPGLMGRFPVESDASVGFNPPLADKLEARAEQQIRGGRSGHVRRRGRVRGRKPDPVDSNVSGHQHVADALVADAEMLGDFASGVVGFGQGARILSAIVAKSATTCGTGIRVSVVIVSSG